MNQAGSVYTQMILHSERPTQILASLQPISYTYMLPLPTGALVCEKISEATDLRIIQQVAEEISCLLKPGFLLAIAGDTQAGFWCRLILDGESLFEHNRLGGPRELSEKSASLDEVGVLCKYFGATASPEEVHTILTSPHYKSAVDRHGALAIALGLPAWTAGVGYSRMATGDLPAEAGEPRKPSRSVAELRPADRLPRSPDASDPLAVFQQTCRTEFGFLRGFRFREEAGRQPSYQNQYVLRFRNQHLIVLIEGLSYGGKTRLCLIDLAGRLLDLTELVEKRDAELLDLCHLAAHQQEQIPLFSSALFRCAGDVLAGDFAAISPVRVSVELNRPFSFTGFMSRFDKDYVQGYFGPQGGPRTILARLRWATHVRLLKYGMYRRWLSSRS